MMGSVAAINGVIAGHHSTHARIRLAGDSISDEEAVASLKGARTDWIPGRPSMPALRQRRLDQTLSYVREGLSNHFAVEEALLPLLLDQMLMRALMLDHRRIIEKIDEASAVVTQLDLTQLGRTELLVRECEIRGMIDNICHLIEDHATKEDIVLDFMLKALQEL